MMMTEIHCHTCGGRITDPTIVSYRRADGAIVAAVPRTGLCSCARAIVYGPPAERATCPRPGPPADPSSPHPALRGSARGFRNAFAV